MFAVDPAMNLPVDEAGAADSCSQGRHHQRVGLPPGTEMKLTNGGGIGIVFQVNRDSKGLTQWCDNVCVLPTGQGVRVVNRAAERVHRASAAYANAAEGLPGP